MIDDGFKFGEYEHIALKLREPEPSRHPDERMNVTLTDLYACCPPTGIEIGMHVEVPLPNVKDMVRSTPPR